MSFTANVGFAGFGNLSDGGIEMAIVHKKLFMTSSLLNKPPACLPYDAPLSKAPFHFQHEKVLTWESLFFPESKETTERSRALSSRLIASLSSCSVGPLVSCAVKRPVKASAMLSYIDDLPSCGGLTRPSNQACETRVLGNAPAGP